MKLLGYITTLYRNTTIRTRLALQFTAIFAVILSLVFATVYELSAISSRVAFRNELKDRAITAAEVFLAGDNLTKSRFRQIQKRYEVKLPDEVIRAYNKLNQPVFIADTPKYWAAGMINEVRGRKEFFFKAGNRECCGIYYHDNQGDYVIISSAVDSGSRQRLGSLELVLGLTFFITLTIVYTLGQWFALNALRPILGVIKQVQGISASNLHLRVEEGLGQDEITELAVTFNNLLVRLETSFDMQKSFVSNASHELRTPITSFIGEIEVTLNRTRSSLEYQDTLSRLLEQAERLKEITNSLLDLAYTGSEIEKKEEVRIDELIWDLKKHFDEKAGAPVIDVQMKNLPEEQRSLVIPGNRQLLFIAFGNIVSNAIKFSSGEKVTCSLNFRNKKLYIMIQDKGIGIEKTALGQIFQPFFRAENARKFGGQGIGLSLSEKIISLHRGEISIDSQLNRGTLFTIVFHSEYQELQA